MNFSDSEIEKILEIASLASQRVVEVYKSSDFEVDLKKDNSPLTLADRLAQEVIAAGLKEAFPEIPIISEEAKEIPFSQRSGWDSFWLVDPLDGTKEFIQKNGEFTVNIALIEKTIPVFGVVVLPAYDQLYFGLKSKGAFRQDKGGKSKPIRTRKPLLDRITVVRSRSHSSKEEDRIISSFVNPDVIHAGSSLKFCRVAEGQADLYLRSGPTMEWDTAAGQAIAEASGAVVANLDGTPFSYNKESLKNPGFICASNRDLLHNLLENSKL